MPKLVTIAASAISATKDAAQDLLAADLTMQDNTPFDYWEVYIEGMDSAAALKYTIDGTNFKFLNKSLSLIAGSSYTLYVPALPGQTFNLQLATGSAITVKGNVKGFKE